MKTKTIGDLKPGDRFKHRFGVRGLLVLTISQIVDIGFGYVEVIAMAKNGRQISFFKVSSERIKV